MKRPMVFTNGCFDIFHAGHVDYLERARAMGECLVVGINSDSSVRKLKGASRPINRLADRIRVLEALRCVDMVVPFSEATPLNLIIQINPQVLVKGGDYLLYDIVGYREVTARGGLVFTIPSTRGVSTTKLIERMRA